MFVCPHTHTRVAKCSQYPEWAFQNTHQLFQMFLNLGDICKFNFWEQRPPIPIGAPEILLSLFKSLDPFHSDILPTYSLNTQYSSQIPERGSK